jgi:hypothetical protein
MRGHLRYRGGDAGQLVVNAKNPLTCKRKPVFRTIQAPNTRRGRQAETELAKLLAEVEARPTLPSSGVTMGQLMERWVAHRRPGWEERSPRQPDATLARRSPQSEPDREATTRREWPTALSRNRSGCVWRRLRRRSRRSWSLPRAGFAEHRSRLRVPVLAMYQGGPGRSGRLPSAVRLDPGLENAAGNLEPLTEGQLRACRLIASLTHIKRAGTFRARQVSMTGRALT